MKLDTKLSYPKVDIPEADVTWYFNDCEIVAEIPNFDHFKFVDEERERKLIIKVI